MSNKAPWVPLLGYPNYPQYTYSEGFNLQGLDVGDSDYPVTEEVQLDGDGMGYQFNINQQPLLALPGPPTFSSSSSPSSNEEGSLGTNQDSNSDSSLSSSWVLEEIQSSSSYAPPASIYPPVFDYNDSHASQHTVPRSWREVANQRGITDSGVDHNEALESILTSRQELSEGFAKSISHQDEDLQCSWCNARMSRAADMKRHELIHQDKKPFICGDCVNSGKRKAFGRKDHLTQHMRKAHDLAEHQKPAVSCAVCSEVPEEQQLYFAIEESHMAHFNKIHNRQPRIENGAGATSKSAESQTAYTGADCADALCGRSRKQVYASKRAIGPPSPSTTRRTKCKRLDKDEREFVASASNAGSRRSPIVSVPSTSNRSKGRKDLRPRNDADLQRIFSEAPSPLPINDPHSTFVRNFICEYDNIRMEPVEFLALSKFQEFRAAEERESVFMKFSGNTSIPVVYNVVGSVLKLRGNIQSIECLKKLALNFLGDLRSRTQSKVLWNKTADTLSAPRTSFRLNAKTLTTSSHGANVRVFPVRAKEEKLVISFWSETLARQLPEILNPRIGKKYSVGLVRQGTTGLNAKVTVRIQSPNGQSKATREDIQEAVDLICRESQREPLPVHFSTGHVTPLAQVEGTGHIDNERSEEAAEFPHYKRYWDLVGMGGSIGPLGCNRVTATLGGFVSLDGEIFALSVDHFISESLNGNSGSGAADPLPDLTSPSLSDVQLMREDLGQTLREMGVTVKRCMRAITDNADEDISLAQVDEDSALQEHEMQKQQYMTYLEELTKPDDHFLWAKVEHRSPEPTRRLSPQFARRMDWSLSKVNKGRLGENRHRYSFDIACPKAEDIHDAHHPKGTGHPCRETCDVEPGASVLYFGQRNGYQRAKINAAQHIVSCDDDDWTFEWLVISNAIQGFDCAGDSGAWVVDSRMRIIGMVWSWADIGLAFTPINEIFDDIYYQLQLNTPPTLPHLPIEPGSSPIPLIHTPSQATLACDIKELAHRKPRSYRFAIPILGGSPHKLSLPVQGSTASTDDGASEDGSQMTQPPSLSSSTASTPGTPSEVPPPLTPVDEGPEPILVLEDSARQEAPKASNIDKIEVLKACEALQKNVHDEIERRKQLPDEKLSIPYLLADTVHPQTPATKMGIAA